MIGRTRLIIFAVILGVGQIADASAQSTDGQGNEFERGRQLSKTNCGMCHGLDGNNADPQMPKLAGQAEDYLAGRTLAFKDGSQKSDIMAGIAAELSADEIADVAAYYSRQDARPDPVKDRHLAELGERIFNAGAAAHMGPACGMCHHPVGQNGMGMMEMMGRAPNLIGQHAAYIFDQLTRFASGERASPMMGRIASSLTNMEKVAVAEYLSGLR